MLVTVHRFPLPFGAGLTLALPGRVLILVRQYVLDDPRYAYVLEHERCHARQVERWGVWGYYRRHIMARIRTRNLLAENDPIERECYDGENGAEA